MNIQTVTGTIPVDALGVTLMHEHVLLKYPGAEFDPAAQLDREAFVAEASRRLGQLRTDHGVCTLVDPCPVEFGRDVTILREVSQRSGVRIICATGFYFDALGIPPYWRNSTVEQIAEFYIREIEVGVMDTGIRAGVIKCATGGQAMTPAETKCLQAAALAQKATGVPIITHTQGGVGGIEQQSLFVDAGVPLHHVLIGHCCESDDRGYHAGLAARGSYVGFDRIGWAQFQSDTVRADCIADLDRAGHGQRILISQDRYCGMQGRPGRQLDPAEAERMRLAKERGEWPPAMTYLFTDFLPLLRQRGFTAGQIDGLLVANPARFFRDARGSGTSRDG